MVQLPGAHHETRRRGPDGRCGCGSGDAGYGKRPKAQSHWSGTHSLHQELFVLRKLSRASAASGRSA